MIVSGSAHNFTLDSSEFAKRCFKMSEVKQCCYICSLRTGTLVLLWIVLIGCSFHIWNVNLNTTDSTTDDNKTPADTKNSAVGSNSAKIIRKKRSIVGNNIFDTGKLNPFDKVSKTVDGIGSKITQAVQSIPDKTKNAIDDSKNTLSNLANKVEKGVSRIKEIIPSEATKIAESLHNEASNLGGKIINETGKTIENEISVVKQISSNISTTIIDNLQNGTKNIVDEASIPVKFIINKTEEIIENGISVVKEIPSKASSVVDSLSNKTKTTVDDFSTLGKDFINEIDPKETIQNGISAVKEISPNEVSKITENLQNKTTLPLDQMGNLVHNASNTIVGTVKDPVSSVKQTVNTIENLPENLRDRIGDDVVIGINKLVGVDKRLGNLESMAEKVLLNCVHYFFLIWSILGIISSVLGIYGILKIIPKCLTFSVFFFYLSVISGLFVILEINVDSNTDRKIIVLNELAKIDWKDLENSTIVSNAGLSFFIGVSLYFAIVVKRCRSMLQNIILSKKKNATLEAEHEIDATATKDTTVIANV
ncbi:uncharacterized protein LOC135834978 [Planococcus citri]|uniref:uncharacterized protein LOC135834978 n=1 Tax=Planococcus citri TaxID=170843 RepID=UPI0031F747BB